MRPIASGDCSISKSGDKSFFPAGLKGHCSATMKILWVKSDFLHPTTKGGQIRTLEMLRRLHARHDIHYVAFDDLHQPEGLQRHHEYCSHAYPIRHDVPPRRSLRFAGELAAGLVAPLPVS